MPKPKPKPKRRPAPPPPRSTMIRVSVEFADYLTDRAKRQGITRCTLTRQLADTLVTLQPGAPTRDPLA